MDNEKEPCGLDITLEDIRKIENQHDVTIRVHFNKWSRAWCFDFEKHAFIERIAMSTEMLKDATKESIITGLMSTASKFA